MSESKDERLVRMKLIYSMNCSYCSVNFLPAKRFVQKYCSESCRVMACRERKYGSLDGTGKQLQVRTTNVQMLRKLTAENELILAKLDNVKKHIGYIEIGGVLKILYDFYMDYKKNNKDAAEEQRMASIKILLTVLTKGNEQIKTDIKNLGSLSPEYSEMINKLF